jgi:hypothetical protein
MPTLFGDDEASSLRGIAADPVKNHYDLSKIHRAFFVPENIELLEAVSVCKKPREGAGLFSFKKPKLTSLPSTAASSGGQPAEKRARLTTQTSNLPESGGHLLFNRSVYFSV